MPSRRHALFWITVVGLLGAMVWVLSPMLTPFIVGLLVAYMLDPLVDRLERLGIGRGWASMAVLGGFFVSGAAAMLAIIPFLWGQMMDLIGFLPSAQSRIMTALEPWWDKLQPLLTPETLAKAEKAATDFSGTALRTLGDIVRSILAGGFALVDVASLLFVTPLVSFYLVKDWDRIVATVDGYLPRRAAPIVQDRAREINATLASWLRGQALVCLILGTFYSVALSLLGVRYGLLIGIVAGVFTFIPFVGYAVGLVLSLVAAFFSFDSWAMIGATAGIFVIGQVIEGNVLTPKLVGKSVGLHEVWVMFALMAGGSLFGFVGVLLAVPVAAVIGVLLRYALFRYRDSDLYHQGAMIPDDPQEDPRQAAW